MKANDDQCLTLVSFSASKYLFFIQTAVILSLQQIRPGGSQVSSKCISRQQHKCTHIICKIHVCNTLQWPIGEFGAYI